MFQLSLPPFPDPFATSATLKQPASLSDTAANPEAGSTCTRTASTIMSTVKQADVAKYLRRAESADEVEEVLGAYAFSKQQKGYVGTKVHRTLYLLSLYLNAVDLGPLMRKYPIPFSTIASLALSSTPIQHVVSPTTRLGLEAWNQARRRPTNWFTRKNSSESSSSTVSSAASSVHEGQSAAHSLTLALSWRNFLSMTPPTYSNDTAGYVDREGEEGRRRVEEDNSRPVDLPSYA
ncbi:hypothetical protein JCM8547_002198 [Rhodosporidiobolus lusitaniae]